MMPLRVLESACAAIRIVGRAAAVHAYEVGALASTAAMAPKCFVGGGFGPGWLEPRQFCSSTGSGARKQAGP